MFFKVPIILYTLLQTFIGMEAQWCTYHKPVEKTKQITITGQRTARVTNDYGQPYIKMEVHTYLKLLTYMSTAIAKACCPGYIQNGNNCEPVCEPKCPINSVCYSPGKCLCLGGYEKLLFDANESMQCKPICPDGCPANSECVSPGSCECKNGFELKETSEDLLTCEPECRENCTSSIICAGANDCKCQPGYIETLNGNNEINCKPICEPACAEHAYCRKPNKCNCLPGYHKVDNTCKPKCAEVCPVNSICVGPKTCQCNEGYTMNTDGKCVSKCEETCPAFAYCNKFIKCVCQSGYTMKQYDNASSYCEPTCLENCGVHSKCISPNSCACLEGYEIHRNSIDACQPKCSKGCANGDCVAPEKCICHAGYQMSTDTNLCKPICSQVCVKGICIAPDLCQCVDDYRFINNSSHECEPICKPACIKAKCVAPNHCICLDHYEASVDSAHICKPSNETYFDAKNAYDLKWVFICSGILSFLCCTIIILIAYGIFCRTQPTTPAPEERIDYYQRGMTLQEIVNISEFEYHPYDCVP